MADTKRRVPARLPRSAKPQRRFSDRSSVPPELSLQGGLSEALVRSSRDGILAFDREVRYTLWNPAMERLTGVASHLVLGQSAYAVFPFLLETGEDHYFREALAGRDAVAYERPFRIPESGRQGFFEGHYSPLRGADGEILGGVCIVREVAERKAGEPRQMPEQATRAELDAAMQRLSLLAEVSRELSSTLDAHEAFARLADLTLSVFADYCVVDVFTESGEIRRELAAHKDPSLAPLMDELRGYPPRVGARAGMGRVLRTGEPLFAPEVGPEEIEPAAQDERHREILLALAPTSSILVPVMTHGTIFGAITFALCEGQRRYGPADLALAEELGRRAAQVMDNARLYREAQRALRELAEADRRKDEFLAMLAHELRNPLGAIANAGHVLDQRRTEDPQTRALLSVISRQIRHLSRLVDDLLDVSRVTRGQVELRLDRVELHPLVRGAVETVQPLIEQRRHELRVTLPDEPLWLDADATRIEQVLTNLLNNAAKFTDPGGRLSVEVRRSGDEAAIEIADDGPGIAPELLPRVFDLFVQEERSLARSHGGLGIGLTLVRSLIERHGGRVEAASDGPGRGSRFTVRLPLRPAPAAAAAAEPPALATRPGPERPADAAAHILLVEDNEDAAGALGELLSIWGHEVDIANEGPTALEKARQHPPDVVLLDIGLPGMDGYEVAKALRAQPGLERTRLIALTGYGQETDRRRSSLAGFDHHLVKPVDVDHLRRLLSGSSTALR
jgi:PAS domain S-box-containing protein